MNASWLPRSLARAYQLQLLLLALLRVANKVGLGNMAALTQRRLGDVDLLRDAPKVGRHLYNHARE